MAVMESLRRGHGEQRRLIDAPGHLFEATEKDEAIGHCYLAVIFHWTAYLYLASGAVTLLFWEGDLIDVWNPSKTMSPAIEEVVRKFELPVAARGDG